jgi:hypothetical protein
VNRRRLWPGHLSVTRTNEKIKKIKLKLIEVSPIICCWRENSIALSKFPDDTLHFDLLDGRAGNSPDDSRQVLLHGRTRDGAFTALLPVGHPADQPAKALLLSLFRGTCRFAAGAWRGREPSCGGHRQRL